MIKKFEFSKSDIEEILFSQRWKQKKTNSIKLKSIKNITRAIDENQTPQLKERDSFLPYLSKPCRKQVIPDDEIENSEIWSNKKDYSAVNKLYNSNSSVVKKQTENIQIPTFPKREFGKIIKNHSIIPSFKFVESPFTDREILEMKLGSGRIKKKARYNKINFEYLRETNKISNELAVFRPESKYNKLLV